MPAKDGREYIRHPSDIPITIEEESLPSPLSLALNNVSQGGLAFDSPKFIEVGTLVNVQIHIVKSDFKVSGVVQWCQRQSPSENHFEVGIEYVDRKDAFRVRMVEQICHIEQYRREIEQKEGRPLSGEAAAIEWITKHAAEFPNPDAGNNSEKGGAN